MTDQREINNIEQSIDQNEVHSQLLSTSPKERFQALKQLKYNFSLFSDKQQVWKDLIQLVSDENYDIKYGAASILYLAFSQVPDKQLAWNDLIKLSTCKDNYVRFRVISALDLAISQVPNKQQELNDLHDMLTKDQDAEKKHNDAVKSIDQNEIHSQLLSISPKERLEALELLRYNFSLLPDKQLAWNDLIQLTNDQNGNVRYAAASIFDLAFSQVSDKQQAWNDLIKLSTCKDDSVKFRAASALNSAYSFVPDQQQVWNDLNKLANYDNHYLRAYASHSLGKICIFRASQAESEEYYKQELERAIALFEKAAQEPSFKLLNPAQFCLPFYRSFYTIVFEKQGAKEEVDKYLAEAKNAIKGSKSKELLFEATENLANALKEVQKLENMDFEAKRDELNFYRKYCDQAAGLIRDTEEKTPYATAAMRKGLPILDKNIKELLEEIQKKAKIACHESKGTNVEEFACAFNKEVQKWEIGSQEEMTQKVEDIGYLLKMKIADLPENRYLLNKIEAMKLERNLAKQYDALLFVIGQIPTMKVISEQKLDQKLQKFDRIFDEIICVKEKLNCISFDISKIKLNSADVISYLETMKAELEKLSKIGGLNTLSIEKLDYIQAEKINGFNNNILGRLDEIQILINQFSKDNDRFYLEFSKRLDELKQSKLDTLLQRYSAVISLIDFVISGISIAR